MINAKNRNSSYLFRTVCMLFRIFLLDGVGFSPVNMIFLFVCCLYITAKKLLHTPNRTCWFSWLWRGGGMRYFCGFGDGRDMWRGRAGCQPFSSLIFLQLLKSKNRLLPRAAFWFLDSSILHVFLLLLPFLHSFFKSENIFCDFFIYFFSNIYTYFLLFCISICLPLFTAFVSNITIFLKVYLSQSLYIKKKLVRLREKLSLFARTFVSVCVRCLNKKTNFPIRNSRIARGPKNVIVFTSRHKTKSSKHPRSSS